ncbi:hypothetical protein BKA61DRAFT_25241 [Leptodontidium sp. MPI-SDFR-AT-0119]|nr:hypothetical protein BKA61DRAFT_25241 [Leptodontidium sp. MPI-SDFR-AT-0119]
MTSCKLAFLDANETKPWSTLFMNHRFLGKRAELQVSESLVRTMKSGSASTLVVVVFMLLLACLQRLVLSFLTVITNKFHQEPPPHTRGSALGRQARQDPIQIPDPTPQVWQWSHLEIDVSLPLLWLSSFRPRWNHRLYFLSSISHLHHVSSACQQKHKYSTVS